MQNVSPDIVEFVLSKIDDGFLFERFAKEFLGHLRGVDFEPVGGVKDKGIDGLEYAMSPAGRGKIIYQASIEKSAKSKLEKTISALKKNGIECERLFYVTNQRVKDRPSLEEEFYEQYNVTVQIWDIDWFQINVNAKPATIEVFNKFQSSYLHEFEKPGKAYEVSDLASDPRVFVFLRQQWDIVKNTSNLDEVLADSLILFVLEGTDPDKKILRSRAEILDRIAKITQFDPKWLHPTIDKRLKALSTKPRKIRHHRNEDAYCLPYETRLEIQQRNIADYALYEKFREETTSQLAQKLSELGISIGEPYKLLEDVLHRLFRQQGLEFSNFVSTGDGSLSVEKSLQTIVHDVIDDSKTNRKDRQATADVLLQVIRGIIYNGTNEQLQFIRRLADTYRLLFLLQCDPKIATYFATMVSKLRVYVDTSILIPAISEYLLETHHRRHWNLLTSSKRAGVTLIVNDVIILELVSHFKRVVQTFKEKYEGTEDKYSDDISIIYVDDILIRAFFYGRLNGQVKTFDEFLKKFVSLERVMHF
jgi:hypothetical protein